MFKKFIPYMPYIMIIFLNIVLFVVLSITAYMHLFQDEFILYYPHEPDGVIAGDEPDEIFEEPYEDYEEIDEGPFFYCALTALRVPTKEQAMRRPAAIMLDNRNRALPHLGISRAGVIYEFLVEDGITRLMMLTTDYEDAPIFGPIRSARIYYIPIALQHDAVYIHAGGDEMAYTELRRSRINNINEIQMRAGVRSSELFFRDAERRRNGFPFEHTLMMAGSNLRGVIERYNYRVSHEEGFEPPYIFGPTVLDGESAVFMRLYYSRRYAVEFTYDPDTGHYFRSQYGEPHIDGTNGAELSFMNVVVLYARYTPTGHANGYLRCDLERGGDGKYLTGGRYINITWRFDPARGRIVMLDANGDELILNPGRTFFCIPPFLSNHPTVIY